MSKFDKMVNGILLKPIYDGLREAKKEEDRRYNSLLNQVSQNIEAQRMEPMKPKVFEVHQPFDSIIHKHDLW